MRVVVVGVGKVGSTVSEYLAKEGHAVTIVDQDPAVVERVTNRQDMLGVCGNGASLEVQKEAGVAKAELFVSLTSEDAFNILCCIMAKKNGAKHVIARVRNPVYFQQMLFLREELGLSMAINPEMEVADAIGRMLRFPSATKLELFAKGRLEMAEVTLPPVTPLDGVTLQELQNRFGAQVLVCAVCRGQQVTIPTGNFALRAGDHISISAGHADLNTFFKRTGLYRDSVRSVLIVGGGRIAYYRASLLGMLNTLGIESAVSSRTVTGERIVGYVRGLSNSQGSGIQTLYRLLDGRMEALEFAVRENAPFVGKTLQQLTFRPGVLIVGIVREEKLIHPQGSDSMQPGDLVTVVTTIPGIQTLEQTLAEGKA